MFSEEEFCVQAGIERATLQVWVEEGWLVPHGEISGLFLSDVDLARARLIGELRKDMGVNDEGIGIILNLIDQVHGLRSMLHAVIARIGSADYSKNA